MAAALDMRVSDVEYAITKEGARIGAPMFDKLASCCTRSGHSMDDILAKYDEDGL